MMKYYFDIILLPGAEDSIGFLWQKVYQQVHIALVDNGYLSDELVKGRNGKQEPLKKSRVALSFPSYRKKSGFPLGHTLRLLAETQKQLEDLNIKDKLNRLTDYTDCRSIQPVDESEIKKHVCFMRKQFKSPSKISADIERRAKYLANKAAGNFEEIKVRLVEKSKTYDNKSSLPFINLTSLSSKPNVLLSNKDRFLLFIEMQEMETQIKGDFTCYGLSRRNKEQQATVPWF